MLSEPGLKCRLREPLRLGKLPKNYWENVADILDWDAIGKKREKICRKGREDVEWLADKRVNASS